MGKGVSASDVPAEFKRAAESATERGEAAFDIARPSLEAGASVIQDLIRTGGSGSTLPFIQQSVQQTLAAGNQARERAIEAGVRSGLSGGEITRLANEAIRPFEQQAAIFGPSIAAGTATRVGLESAGAFAPGLQALVGAANSQANLFQGAAGIQAAQQQALGQALGGIFGGLGTAAGGGFFGSPFGGGG